MNKTIIEEDDFEWDRTRLMAVLVILLIIVGVGWTAMRFYTPETIVQNVQYSTETDQGSERFNTLYGTFFGGSPEFENITLVILTLLISEIPDVTRLTISISSQLPTHLDAIILAEWQNEVNILHGVSAINDEQTSYALTINGGGMDLVLYLFFEGTTSGSYDLNIRAYNTG